MENKNGNGIFLGVVSVATLIVAIIGATFAFFSVSVNSAENAVELSAYEFNAGISVSQIYPVSGAALVPLNPSATITNASAPNNTNLLYAINEATNRCVDTNQFQVCAMYSVTFTNNSAQPITLNGVIRTVTNSATTSGRPNATAFTDLQFQKLSGTTLGSFTLDGAAVDIDETEDGTADIGSVTIPGATTVGDVTTAGSVTKYVVVYMNETTEDQSDQMGATYTGQLVYTSENGSGNELTGTFTIAGQGGQEPGGEEPSGGGE